MKQVENLFPPGFRRYVAYTGEEKGGLDPEEEVVVFQTTLPLNTYITYIPYSTTGFNESLDILNILITLTLTNNI